MRQLTAADFADTGQWRLRINIYPDGMDAGLENMLYDDVGLQQLFESKWETDGSFLSNLENAVYEHPRVLDDFAAKIVIYDRKTLFIPTRLADETEGSEEDYYMSFYEVEPADIMTDIDRDLTAAWSPGKGIRSFLLRTFPGALVTCNLMDRVKTKRKLNINGGKCLYVIRRDGETDFVALDGSKLLGAVTHSTDTPAEALYHTLNLTDVLGMIPSETSISWENEEPGEEIKRVLKIYRGNHENNKREIRQKAF